MSKEHDLHMKKSVLSVFILLGLAVAPSLNALASNIPDGYKVLKYISSDDSAQTWATGTKVGPYLQIYNQDKSPFVLGADDVVETKFLFNSKDNGACVFCVRGSSSGKFVLMRAGNSPYKARFDYGTVNNELDQKTINLNNTDAHTVTASKSKITVDGATIVPTESIYEPFPNALLLFCCDSSGNGIASAGNKGTIKMYYFRVKDGSGNLRLNLVPMLRIADSKPGLYDAVSGQFFTNKSTESGEFTYGSAGIMDRIAAATAFSGATDPAAEGGDYVFKDGYDYIHVFSSVGEGKSFTVTKDRTAQILVVGGGAGGAKGNGGSGGNAGELVSSDSVALTSGSYSVAVGAGGAGDSNPGGDGGESSLVGESVNWVAAGGTGQAITGGAGHGGSGAGGSGTKGSGNGNCGNGGPAVASDILGWTEAFAGGGGGGSQYASDATVGKGGSVVIDGVTVTVGGNGTRDQWGGGGSGVGNTGSAGGGSAAMGTGGWGGSGIVIIRLSKTKVEISGEISMPDWTEGEAESEPTGLTVTPTEAESAFAYKYYANAGCTEAIQKPSTKGTYYVRGEVAESDSWNPAVSAAAQFKIIPAGGGKEIVEVPTITTAFTYTGDELSPVAAGEHYSLTGDAAKTLAGNYTATLALEDAEKYMWGDTFESEPKVIKWTIAKAENKWTVEPGIDKTAWKSEDDPGVVTLPVAQFGEPKAQIARKVNGEYADWTDWDCETMPTEKGKYKIRWQVAELAGGYTALETAVEFLVDYRYEPTHPFMYQKDGDADWKGADTFSAALNGISGSGYLTGTIELCQDITDTTDDKMGKLDYRFITLRSNPDEGKVYVWTRPGKQYNGFLVQNGSTLTISDIVFNLTTNGANKMNTLFELGVSVNEAGGEVTLGMGAVIQGVVSGSLYSPQKGASFILDGATIRNLTAGGDLLPMPAKSFSVNSGTIENCTVGGAIIPLGSKTLTLKDVTITNNTTAAGAITVNYVNELTNGVIKVSGDVIVKDNKVGGDEKNIVLKNAANLQMTGALGDDASIGVTFGVQGDVFGKFAMTEATKEDKATAVKFFNDARPSRLFGRVNANNELFWYTSAGTLLMLR